MNLSGEGHTIGSAEEGFSNAEHAPNLRFSATANGILLRGQQHLILRFQQDDYGSS
jgi:hypothetical protein